MPILIPEVHSYFDVTTNALFSHTMGSNRNQAYKVMALNPGKIV